MAREEDRDLVREQTPAQEDAPNRLEAVQTEQEEAAPRYGQGAEKLFSLYTALDIQAKWLKQLQLVE